MKFFFLETKICFFDINNMGLNSSELMNLTSESEELTGNIQSQLNALKNKAVNPWIKNIIGKKDISRLRVVNGSAAISVKDKKIARQAIAILNPSKKNTPTKPSNWYDKMVEKKRLQPIGPIVGDVEANNYLEFASQNNNPEIKILQDKIRIEKNRLNNIIRKIMRQVFLKYPGINLQVANFSPLLSTENNVNEELNLINGLKVGPNMFRAYKEVMREMDKRKIPVSVYVESPLRIHYSPRSKFLDFLENKINNLKKLPLNPFTAPRNPNKNYGNTNYSKTNYSKTIPPNVEIVPNNGGNVDMNMTGGVNRIQAINNTSK